MREYLKKLRTEHGYSVETMAEKLGITRQYYHMIEAGERQQNMDISLVSRIALILGIEITYIVSEEEKLKMEV